MLKNIFLLITRFHLQTQTQVLRDPLSQIILKLFLFATVHTSLFVFFRSSNQSKNKIILQEILLFYSKVTRKIQILLLKILYYYYYLSLILLI